jgi:hypothetical protein
MTARLLERTNGSDKVGEGRRSAHRQRTVSAPSAHHSRRCYDRDSMLPVIWTVFALCAVGGFIMIAAYWLDVQDRPDLTTSQRIAWSVAAFVCPVSIPAYAFLGGPGWPAFLRAASALPAIALALFFGFLFGVFG